jgi:DNA repair protein RadA/Sms
MTKATKVFICQECGAFAYKWQGRCQECGSWNSFVEEAPAEVKPAFIVNSGELKTLAEINSNEENRIQTGMEEFDRVLGGGIVPGSLVLIGGAPGIGKSTLILQAAQALSQACRSLLYVSGEESLPQIKLRAQRLGVDAPNLWLYSEVNLANIIAQMEKTTPEIVFIDSIQTLYKQELSSAPGSVSQVRECTAELLRFSKAKNITVIIIGHITKDGSLAGPRVLEHIVDTVLYFEGESHQNFRLLKSTKNRFGSTHELGVFEMGSRGLVGIKDPSAFFLAHRNTQSSGSVIVPVIEGSRPFLVELQALASRTNFGIPARRALGVDFNRMNLMLAVLEKRAHLSLGMSDVYISLVGGVEVEEPALDLGLIMAVASSFLDKPVDAASVVIGEVGLGGEVRPVPQLERRLYEAQKLGFKRALVPKSLSKIEPAKFKDMEIIEVENIRAALKLELGNRQSEEIMTDN